MPIRATDTIVGPSRGAPENWKTDDPEVKQWIRDVYTTNKADDLPDAAIVVAQAFLETGNFTNRWWKERKNAGSLGVTGDPAQDEASPTFKTTLASARAMSAHDLLYATGEINRGGLSPRDDPRYAAYREEYGTSSYPRLADLSGRYAEDRSYADNIVRRASEVYTGTLPNQQETGMELITYGRVPKPPIIEMICTKYGPGHGYFQVAPRQLVGGCRHITDGNQSIEWYHEFFSIGGERESDALVDFIIDKDGRIAMFNDPWGTRSPWANGGSDGLEGDGVAFTNTLGISAINNRLFSCEHIGTAPGKMTAKQMASSIWLWAWMFDQMKVPYTGYPVNPSVGLRTDLEHWEFATKGCPGDGIRAQVNEHQAGVKAMLQKHQVTDAADTPTEPAPTPSIYPPGMTLELARRLYGELKVSWAKVPFSFDPERSECRRWLDEGKSELQAGEDYTHARWPKLEDVIRRGNGNRVFTWEGGLAWEQAARST